MISGNEALAFVRDRHGIGNGGDLGRIQMQQMFVSSLIKKVMSAGTLSDPVTLYLLADAATKSLTTDPGLGSVQALLGLAESLRSLKLGHITFVTLPTKLDPANIDRLLPDEPAVSAVWRLLREDLPWTIHLPGAPPRARTVRAVSAKPEPPSSVSSSGVQTRNASANICSGLPSPNDLGELGS